MSGENGGIILVVLMLTVGLVLVVLGSDVFVDTAVRIAKRFRVSESLIGATLVSIGTTLPELTVSCTAAAQGHLNMAAGNAIGSVICNTALIAGMVQAIRPTALEPVPFRRNCTRFALSAAAFCALVYTGGGLSRIGGVTLVALFLLYLGDSYVQAAQERHAASEQIAQGSFFHDLLVMLLMAGALFLGADLLVDNGSRLAESLGIPERVISTSMIALGTSLPELITALTALRKKHAALSLGNVIGANILNLLFVSGASAAIAPMGMGGEIRTVDIPVMVYVSAVLMIPGLLRKKLCQWQGVLLLVSYGIYIAYLYFFR